MKSLSDIFDQEMDRKEFLVYLGLVILTITGISGIMKNISNLDPANTKKSKVKKGFGKGPYGI